MQFSPAKQNKSNIMPLTMKWLLSLSILVVLITCSWHTTLGIHAAKPPPPPSASPHIPTLNLVQLGATLQQAAEIAGINLPRGLNFKALIEALTKGKFTPEACEPCSKLVGFLQSYAKEGHNPTALLPLIKGACAMFKVASKRVCDGCVDILKDTILGIGRAANGSSTEMCSVMMGSVCGKPTSPEHVWNLRLDTPKPPVEKIPEPKKDGPVLKVLHLTDTHYDPEYEPGTNGQCDEIICCDKPSGFPEDPEKKAGKWGFGPRCDVPLRTIASLLDNVNKLEKKPDYVMWTGDLIPHRPMELSRQIVLDNFHTTADLISQKLPNIPVYPCLGNHDTIPQDFFPPPEIKGELSISWLYDEIAKIWGRWLPESAKDTIRKGGYYSVRIKPGLKLISLNTNYCYGRNWWLAVKSADPADQFQWLIEQLEMAEKEGDKVHIIGHTAMSFEECLEEFSAQYRKILDRFENLVRGQFFGHTHFDEFSVMYDPNDKNRPTSVAFVGPSASTYETGNPAFSIYTVDGEHKDTTWSVLDHETHLLYLKENKGVENPQWELAYSAASTYNVTSLVPSEMHKVVKQLEVNDQLLETYYRNHNQRGKETSPSCDEKCKSKLLCQMVSSDSKEAKKCIQ